MPAPVIVNFRVGGVAQLEQAFRTVEQAMLRAERGQTSASSTASSTRVRLAKQEADQKIKLGEAGYRASARQTEQETKVVTKAEKEKLREIESFERQKERIRTRSAELAFKLAEREVAAEKKAHQEIMRSRERMARGIGGTINSSVGGLVNRGVGLAGTALTLGGGFTIAGAVQEQFAAQRTAAQIVNAVTNGSVAPSGANVGNILSKAGGVAVTTGMSKEEITKGTLAYTRSARGGNFEGAMGNMEFIAKLAKTTGTDISEIGTAAGTLQSQNADLGKNPAAMQQMLLNAYAQSKSGSVSMSEAAKQFGTLGSTRGIYQGDEAKNQQTLIGLGQIAAAGGESGDIGTYIKDVSLEASSHRKAKGDFIGLENMGVHFDKTGRMESPEQMLGAVFKHYKGDVGAMQAEVFGKRGFPLISELQKSFLSAGGGDKGVAAMQAQIHGVTASTMTQKDLDAQFQQVMTTPAEKFGVALEKAKEVLEAKLTPYLEKFADKLASSGPQIESAIDAVAKFVGWFVDNPLTGLGAIVLGTITKDLAAAAIGEGVKSSLVALVRGASGAGGGGGGIGGGGTAFGTAAGVAFAAAAGVGLGLAIVDQYGEGKAAERKGDYAASANLFNRAHDPKADNAAKLATIKDLESQVTKKREQRDDKSIGDMTFGALGILTGRGGEVKEAERTKYAAATKEIDDLKAAIKRLRDEIDGGKGGGKSTDPNHPKTNSGITMGQRGGGR